MQVQLCTHSRACVRYCSIVGCRSSCALDQVCVCVRVCKRGCRTVGCRFSCARIRVRGRVCACVTVALWGAGPAVHLLKCVCACASVAVALWGAGPAVHAFACVCQTVANYFNGAKPVTNAIVSACTASLLCCFSHLQRIWSAKVL